jgi:aldose 1-epimerase
MHVTPSLQKHPPIRRNDLPFLPARRSVRVLRPCAALASLLFAVSLGAAITPVSITSFGKLADGREARLYTLTNASGAHVAITDYGAIVVRLVMPDRQGHLDDLVLGYNRVEDYVRATPYFGAIIGRYGNRIANGRFTLDGQTYSLTCNRKSRGVPYHLHGGNVGFDKVLWQAEPASRNGAVGLELRYLSRDGEEGYPGNLDITVHYWLQDDNSLRIDYLATTDRATPVNLTNHSYFNLRGEGRGDIRGHLLTIRGGHITKVNASLIPTGELMPVKDTPLDFTTRHPMGERMQAADEQLKFCGGYDQNWVLDHPRGQLALAAEVSEPETGRTIEVWTDQPGMQFYTGNFLDGSKIGKRGTPYAIHTGFCLETQHFPDSPNHPEFPSTILRPEKPFARPLSTSSEPSKSPGPADFFSEVGHPNHDKLA